MESRILSENSPVACEDMAYCYWAGKGYRLDFFLYGQRVLATKSDTALRHAITGGNIRLAEIDIPYSSTTDDTLTALMQGWSSQTIYRSGNATLIVLSGQMVENKPALLVP